MDTRPFRPEPQTQRVGGVAEPVGHLPNGWRWLPLWTGGLSVSTSCAFVDGFDTFYCLPGNEGANEQGGVCRG